MANLRTRTIFAAGGLLLAAGAPRIDPAQASAARTSVPPSMSASDPSQPSRVGTTPRDDGDDTGDEGDGDDGGDDDRSES